MKCTLTLVSVLLLAVGVPSRSAAASTTTKPNVLLIITDDKYDDRSANFQKRWKNSHYLDFKAIFKFMAIPQNSV